MASDSWVPFPGTNGTSGGFGYLDPQRIIERTFRQVPIRSSSVPIADRNVRERALPADVIETEQALLITIDMPGHDPKTIELSMQNHVLTIRSERAAPAREAGRVHCSERGYGVFTRSFILPQTVDGERIEAGYEQGVLTITMPKREEAKPRTIEIKVSS